MDDTELVVDDGKGKNWRGILIALLVILIICGLVIIAIIIVTPKPNDLEGGEFFSLENWFSNEYAIKRFQGKWYSDEESNRIFFVNEGGDAIELDAETNETKILVPSNIMKNYDSTNFFVSPDASFVLLTSNIESTVHYSFKANYFIWIRNARGSENQLIHFPLDLDGEWKTKKLQFARWTTDGNSLTFVYENNIYFQADPYNTPTLITYKKSEDIINGMPDWIYEEEILLSNVAHWVSPDSGYLAYIQLNETDVPVETYTIYGDPTNIYSTVTSIHYPKAGDKRKNINPVASLFVADLNSIRSTHRQLLPPKDFIEKEYYITLVIWRDSKHLLIGWSNRSQNKTIITICNVVSADCRQNLVEYQIQGRGWVFINNIFPIRHGNYYLAILPQLVVGEGYWRHIALIHATMDGDGRKTFLTYGSYDVTEILAFNNKDNIVYFQSTGGNPRERHIYRLNLSSKTGQKSHTTVTPECLTCETSCLYSKAIFSPSTRYYIHACLGPNIPTYVLRSTENEDDEIVLQNNEDLKKRLKLKILPRKEYFEFDSDDGNKILGQVYFPPGTKKDHASLYPLLIHAYGGPDTQLVTEEFKLDWCTYLTSSENIICAMIDGRGSGGRGVDFMFQIHKKLGTLEVEDQIEGAKYLTNFLHVDKDRLAIWGWSYGGFVAAHALGSSSSESPIKCGIAVAPVTDWRYYDTAYSERYLGLATLADNYLGYDHANLSRKAKYFKNKSLLLVHGTADDNVHFQHSAQFIKALTEAGAPFETLIYPDRNHQLFGHFTTRHLYRSMVRFLKNDCFAGWRIHEKPHAESLKQKPR